jgi:hypothetical protein
MTTEWRLTYGTSRGFRYTLNDGRSVLWDVSKARELAFRRVAGVAEIPVQEMVSIVRRHQEEFDDDRVNAADPAVPGLALPLTDDGVVFYVLVEGFERCARALQDGVPFRARCLTAEDARACVVEAAPGLVP